MNFLPRRLSRRCVIGAMYFSDLLEQSNDAVELVPLFARLLDDVY
jgi:hypothetical protein